MWIPIIVVVSLGLGKSKEGAAEQYFVWHVFKDLNLEVEDATANANWEVAEKA